MEVLERLTYIRDTLNQRAWGLPLEKQVHFPKSLPAVSSLLEKSSRRRTRAVKVVSRHTVSYIDMPCHDADTPLPFTVGLSRALVRGYSSMSMDCPK